MLEPYDGKLSSTVLRGERGSNVPDLPDLERLEKWYGQKIECAPHIARHYRFTFTMHSESLDLILNYISHSAPLNYRLISNDHYIIEEMK